jgi:hypothetical protein
MKIPFCPNEEKVADLLKKGRWPWAADSKLRNHVDNCGRCSDVLFMVQSLQQSRSASMLKAHAASSHELWLKAQLRRHSSIMEQVARPIVWAERFALLGMLCVAIGLMFRQRMQISGWVDWMTGSFPAEAMRLSSFWSASSQQGSLIGYSILAGFAAVACICGFTLFMSDAK